MKQDVFSVGYEGSNVREFIGKLQAAGVEIVVDVRAVPASRKPGFSKSALAAKLEKAGILYVHLKSCGNPERGCSDKRYLALLRKGTGVADLKKLLSTRKRVAVLCFEADPEECHRSLLLVALGRSIRPIHL
jgi:uncharacterized protein (DUF488 family)